MSRLDDFFDPDRMREYWKNKPVAPPPPDKTPAEEQWERFQKFRDRALNDTGQNSGLAFLLKQAEELLRRRLPQKGVEIKKDEEEANHQEFAGLLNQIEDLLDALLLTRR